MIIKYKKWRCRGSNPGPFTCKANALPLSHIPIYIYIIAINVYIYIYIYYITYFTLIIIINYLFYIIYDIILRIHRIKIIIFLRYFVKTPAYLHENTTLYYIHFIVYKTSIKYFFKYRNIKYYFYTVLNIYLVTNSKLNSCLLFIERKLDDN